jgi:hypothetical protein
MRLTMATTQRPTFAGRLISVGCDVDFDGHIEWERLQSSEQSVSKDQLKHYGD